MNNETNSNIPNPLAQPLTWEKLKKATDYLKAVSIGKLYGVTVYGLSNNFCVKCKLSDWDHDKWIAPDDAHPFFNNNLEMLEWLYEQKLKS